MTDKIKRAIGVLEVNKLILSTQTEFCKSADLAIQALEKQIPLKPKFYARNYHCANCANLIGNNEFKWQRFLYCSKCGYKQDWSDEDEED